MRDLWSSFNLSADYDIVDGNVNQFDEESDETHDGEPNRRRHSNLYELLPVWLRASFHQTSRVLSELLARLQLHDQHIHDLSFHSFRDKDHPGQFLK